MYSEIYLKTSRFKYYNIHLDRLIYYLVHMKELLHIFVFSISDLTNHFDLV